MIRLSYHVAEHQFRQPTDKEELHERRSQGEVPKMSVKEME